MLDQLRKLIADSLPAVPDLDPPIHPGDVRVAACALLLRIAHADKRLSREERAVILTSLTTYFGVDERGALELMAAGERLAAEHPDDEDFTRQLLAEYDRDQRLVLADLLWDVAEADGWLGQHEAYLTARLEQWLGITWPRDTPSAD